jgi:serine/threonine-protein kinase RsbW
MSPTDPDLVQFAHLTVPATAPYLHQLRHDVNRCVADLSPDQRHDVLLAINEAATNAVEHAYPPERPGVIDVTLWTDTNALWVEIRDHGHWRDPPHDPRPTGHGLGIPLMHRLIDGVLIHHDRHGTQILLRHPITHPAPKRRPPAPG